MTEDSRKQVLREARTRAQALQDAALRDAQDLKTSRRFADGAACCEDVAEQARRLIAELGARLEGNSNS